MPPLSLLIAGCGDIGTRVGLELAKHGWRVHGLRRRAVTLPAPLIPIRADLSAPHSLRALPVVDHLLYIASAERFDEESYHRVYVQGLRNLLDAVPPPQCECRHQRLLLFISSTAVYGQNDGSWVDEKSPTQPRGFNGQVMLAGEAVAASAPGSRNVCMRFSGIYGPGRGRLVQQVRAGQLAPPHPVVYTNRIHSHDCAGVLAHLLLLHQAGQALQPIYLASDNVPAPLAEVHRYVASKLGGDTKTTAQSVLGTPGTPGASSQTVTSPPAPAQPVTTSPPTRRAGNKRCNNRLLCTTGYHFQYPDYRSGYEAVLTDEVRRSSAK